jgi:hypothetical protein
MTGKTGRVVFISGYVYKLSSRMVRFEVLTAANLKTSEMLITETLIASVINILMTEAVNTPESSFNFYETIRRRIPEHCHVYSSRQLKIPELNSRTIYLCAKKLL